MSLADQQSLKLEEFLPYRLSVITNKVSRDLGNLYTEKFNLTIAEWRVMAVLGRHRDLSAEEVCRKTQMDKVTVSRAVTKLLHKKRIDRKFSDQDRRRSMLRLSKAGQVVYEQIVPIARAYEQRLLAGLSKRDQQQLYRLLDKLNRQAILPSELDLV